MKIRKRNGEIVDVSDTYILQDGEALTVPVMFMDGTRRTLVHDGRGQPAGCRPGFLYADSDTAEAIRETVYAEYRDAIEQRWQSGRWQSEPPKPAPPPPRGGDAAAVEAAHRQYRADIEQRWRR